MAYADQIKPSLRATSPTLQSAIETLDPQLSRLAELSLRAARIADRIQGPRPEPVDGGKAEPPPGHLIGAIQSVHSRLAEYLNDLEGALMRADAR